jgi:two-component system, NarL family, nitrate/nitrite response regulator NarL
VKRIQAAVLIVDPDRRSRISMAAALHRAGYGTRELATGEEAVEEIALARPGLVVLDVLLPGISGYEVCHQLRERFGKELPIIMCSAERTAPADRVAGLLVGADDYIVKPPDPGELIARVRRLLARSAPVGGGGARGLTARELEVLSLLVDGLDQHDIAQRLVISEKTVAKHLEHVLAKLGVRSRAQAVALAVRDRLVTPAPAGAPGADALTRG